MDPEIIVGLLALFGVLFCSVVGTAMTLGALRREKQGSTVTGVEMALREGNDVLLQRITLRDEEKAELRADFDQVRRQRDEAFKARDKAQEARDKALEDRDSMARRYHALVDEMRAEEKERNNRHDAG